MSASVNPDIVTDGLVLCLDAANDISVDPLFNEVSLLLNMDGANGSTTFVDDSKYNHTVTANGNVQISTAQSKFGGSSAYFDGNGDYIQIEINNAFVFGTGQFTVEFWIYWDGTVSGTPYMGVAGVHNSNGTGRYGIFMTSAGISHYIQTAFPSMASLTANKWVHVASTRDQNGVCRFFLDGVVQSTVTDAGNLTAPQGWRIGTDFSSGRPTFPGYIDSFRVIKGKALYTENFTPPSKPFKSMKTWDDLSGNGNHGTLVNGVGYNNSNKGSLVFDGSNNYIEISNNDLYKFSNTQAFSINCWLKCTATVGTSVILAFATTSGRGYYFTIDINVLRTNAFFFDYYSGSSFRGIQGNNNSISTNVWSMLTVTSSSNSVSDMKCYQNGTLVSYSIRGSANPTTIDYTNLPLRIGARGDGGYFKGNISQVSIYNQALTPKQIIDNYKALKGRYGL